MKTLTKVLTMMTMSFILLFTSSCTKEDLFAEVLANSQKENANNSNEDEVRQPCPLTLEEMIFDSTISINCNLDLQGAKVKLPSNIKMEYEGGEIKNGTIIFSGGTIDSELLDISVELQGDVALSTPKYTFIPSKWEIVEGVTTKEISLLNRENINKCIELVKTLEGEVFEIGKLDAYFNVEANKVNRQYCVNRSIRIPSDFHFKMNDDSFLRVQPTNFPAYSLITTMVTDNTIISGGNLIGDRWEHDYSPINDIVGVNRDEHGYGHLIWVIGAHNTILDSIHIKDATGEGIQIHSETIRASDGNLYNGTRTSENIIIKNCFITECRRNNIAVVDATGVIIENCDINDTGKGKQAYDSNGNRIFSSSGTAPKYGIDLEALRYINDDGTMNEINKIDDVVIKNCRFKGNAAGDIDIYTVTNVIIENNYFDKWVANFAANDVIIRNNTFESRDPDITFGINIKSFTRNNKEFNYNYQITGNTIKGYKNGITIAGKNQKVNGNTIIDCQTGIQLKGSLTNAVFFDNKITSKELVSYGYKSFNNAQNTENVKVSNEYIEVKNRPLSFIGFNSESTSQETELLFENCTFNTENNHNFFMHINKGKNIEFENNVSNTDFEIKDSENIILKNNSVNAY